MLDAARHDEVLAGTELGLAVAKLDDHLAAQDEEELIVSSVPVDTAERLSRFSERWANCRIRRLSRIAGGRARDGPPRFLRPAAPGEQSRRAGGNPQTGQKSNLLIPDASGARASGRRQRPSNGEHRAKASPGQPASLKLASKPAEHSKQGWLRDWLAVAHLASRREAGSDRTRSSMHRRCVSSVGIGNVASVVVIASYGSRDGTIASNL